MKSASLLNGLEFWYVSHFVLGAIQNVFIPILIPTFVLEQTGKAGLSGVLPVSSLTIPAFTVVR